VASALSEIEAEFLGEGWWKAVKCPCGAAVCFILFQIGVFSFMSLFLNSQITFMKDLNIVIFYVFQSFNFCGECNRNKLVSIDRLSCALCSKWMACADG
jgi:hypothetical protein